MMACLAIVNAAAMPGMFWIGDPFAWREETRSLLFEGHLWIDAAFAQSVGEPGQYFVRNVADGRWYSKYGLMNALMSAPPMLAERILTGTVAPPAVAPNLTIYNLYNLLLALLLGAGLYGLAGRYSQRPATRALYVFAALYGTYLWYYLRAQSSELYQVLFFIGYFACLMRYLDGLAGAEHAGGLRAAWALGAWTCVLLLVLTRVVFGLLVPLTLAAVAIALLRRSETDRRSLLRRHAWLLTLPPLAVIALLALVQDTKFGSPLFTGYHVWQPQVHMFSGELGRNLRALLFEPPYSLFLYFPPLALAVLAVRRFAARHRLDAAVIGVFLAAWLLTFAKIPVWKEDWGYGMRYLLFILPIVALPFLHVIDWLIDHRSLPAARLGATALFGVLAYSACLNFAANRLDFFAHQYVRPIPALMTGEIAGYFYGRHLGAIDLDLITHRDDLESLPFMRELRARAADASVDEYQKHLKALIDRGNSYWK